jgi:hypothetical protein
MNHNGNMMSV